MSNNGKPLVLYVNTRSLELERSAAVQAALSSGVDLLIAAPSQLLYRQYNLADFIEVSFDDLGDAAERIINHLHEHDLVPDAVVAWTDKEVEVVAHIAETLGLRASTRTAARNVRNKVATRELLAHVSPANPRFATFNDQETFRAATAKVGVPSIVKPAGASGGRGIFRVRSIATADETYQRFRHECTPTKDSIYACYAEQALVEEALQGSEHSVAGIVLDGTVYTYAIMDKRIDESTHVQYQNTTPTQLPADAIRQIVQTTEEAVRRTGINWCGFHVDFIWTSRGMGILEIGGRYGGECINSHLIPMSVPGLDPYSILLNGLRGGDVQLKRTYVGEAGMQAGMRALYPTRFGRIVAIHGLDDVRRHRGVKIVWQTRTPGEQVYHPAEKYNSWGVGHVIAQAPLDADLEELLDEVASMVSIEVE